jgi:hypothetical protein
MKPSLALNPLQMPLGLVLWSLWFVTLYGALSLACRWAPPSPAQGAWTLINLGLGLLTLFTLALLLGLAGYFFRLSRRRPRLDEQQLFVTRVAASVHLVSAIATLFMGLPLLQLAPCV